MKKEDLIAMGLTEEQADKVLEGFKGYVPKTRFDEVNEAKKTAETQLAERDKQLEALKKQSGDAEALKAEIEKLQGENKAAATKYAADLKAMQINNAVERELVAAGAKNIKAVKALLNDLDKAELDGDTVKGLADQIKKLQEDEGSKFLFGEVQKPGVKGMTPNPSNGLGDNPKASEYEAKLADARKNNDTLAAIKIKQEAAAEGIALM